MQVETHKKLCPLEGAGSAAKRFVKVALFSVAHYLVKQYRDWIEIVVTILHCLEWMRNSI